MNKNTIVIAVLIILVVFGFVFFRGSQIGESSQKETKNSTTEEQVVNEEEAPDAIAPMLSREELAAHNAAGDCWIAYGTTVYDVTEWLTRHPGGSAAIAQYCGTADEFTAAFEGQHGERQQALLPEVGVFKGTLIIEG